MKKHALLLSLICILLLCACSGKKQAPEAAPLTAAPTELVPTQAPATPVVPVTMELSFTAEPRSTPTPMPTPTPSPTPTPTPSPTPAGLIGGKYRVFSYEGEQRGEDFYRSENISITVRHASDREHYKNYIEYHVADIYIQDITLLRTGCAGDSFKSEATDFVPNMAKKYGAVFAVNGDYYSENPGPVVRNGILYAADNYNESRKDVCVIYRDGSVRTFTRKNYTAGEIGESDPWQAFTFGPSLLDENGHAMKGLYLGMNANGINPRTIFGYYEPGHYAFITIDGRDLKGSRGLDIETLSRFAEDQGFKVAFNLDGGNSAVMCWNGELYNKPSYGGRQISDIIYIAPEGQDVFAEPANTETGAGR